MPQPVTEDCRRLPAVIAQTHRANGDSARPIKSVLEGLLVQARSKRGLLLPELTYQINFQIQDMDKKAELIKPRGFEQGENVRFFISAERTSQHFDHSAHLSES